MRNKANYIISYESFTHLTLGFLVFTIFPIQLNKLKHLWLVVGLNSTLNQRYIHVSSNNLRF